METATRRADVPLVRHSSGDTLVNAPTRWVDVWGVVHVVEPVRRDNQTHWLIRCDCDMQGSYQCLSTTVPTCLRCVAWKPRR